jgi:hypothetical protein
MRFPGVMTPVPPVNIPVRFVDPPVVTEVGLATKLVIAGAAGATGFTVTVAVWVIVSPAEFVTIRV